MTNRDGFVTLAILFTAAIVAQKKKCSLVDASWIVLHGRERWAITLAGRAALWSSIELEVSTDA